MKGYVPPDESLDMDAPSARRPIRPSRGARAHPRGQAAVAYGVGKETAGLVEVEFQTYYHLGRQLFASPAPRPFLSADLSPEGPASSRRRAPVPPIPGFAEAVGSPSTVTELVEASGATPAVRFPRTPSAASLASVAMEVARDPTLASPRLVELLSPVFPRSVSPDDIQRMMGISPQEAARTAAAGFGKADMVPIDPADAEEM